MANTKQWILMNQVFLVSLLFIAVFAYFDVQNVAGVKQIALASDNPDNVWKVFWDIQSPAFFNMRLLILAGIGLIWYLMKRDKSEALALFLTPAIMIWFGVQDLIYYIIGPDTLSEIGCWATAITPVGYISGLLGETCPTITSFIISAGIGIVIAYYVYKYLQEAKW